MKTIFNFIFLSLLLGAAACTPKQCGVCEYSILGQNELVYESQVITSVGLSAVKQMQGATVAPIPEDALEEYEDAIAEDDILNIVIYHPTRTDLIQSIQVVNDRTGGFRVTNGQVYLPCIEFVPVVNLTLREARERLKQRFEEEIRDVDVFISYKNRLSHRVELAGMVAIAHYPIDGRSRLYEVLASAHLPPQANLFTSYVLRDGQQLDVNLFRLLNEGDMSQNIVMKPGDKVFIGSPTDHSVLVMGEVPLQRPVPVIHGSLPLKEALALAGGLPYTASKRCIQIIRGSLQRPKIFVVSWDFVIHQPNEDLLLIPGDLVYVSATPITDWQRFTLQILPTLQGVALGQSIYYNFR